MEQMPITPQIPYPITIWLIGLTGILIVSIVVIIKKQISKKPATNLTKTDPQAPKVQANTKFNQAQALEAIKKLEQNLKTNAHPDIAAIYANLSFVVRHFIDDKEGSETLSMTDSELQKSNTNNLVQQIIHECYQAEFSGQRASVKQCEQLLIKSKELITA